MFVERAKNIITGLLGKEPTNDHLQMAGQAMWDKDPFHLKQKIYQDPAFPGIDGDERPDLPDTPDAEQKAEILVKSLRLHMEGILKAHARDVALEGFDAAVQAEIDREDFFDAPAPLPPLDELFTPNA